MLRQAVRRLLASSRGNAPSGSLPSRRPAPSPSPSAAPSAKHRVRNQVQHAAHKTPHGQRVHQQQAAAQQAAVKKDGAAPQGAGRAAGRASLARPFANRDRMPPRPFNQRGGNGPQGFVRQQGGLAGAMAQHAQESSAAREGTSHLNAAIKSTSNNTIVSLCRPENGEVVLWASCGSVGYKGARRSTSFAAQAAGEDVAGRAAKLGYKTVDVAIRGLGEGGIAATRGLKIGGVNVLSVQDVTGIPHNGCRKPKKRRL